MKTIEEKIFESKESLEFYREKARNDFEWFLYWIVWGGNRILEDVHKEELIPLFQHVIGDFPREVKIKGRKRIAKPNITRSLFMLPRGTFKSTILTEGAALWFIIRNPNVRIALGSWKQEIANGFLRGIKAHMEENDLLRKMFKYIFWDNPRSEATKWTESEILCIRDRKDREGTVETFGIEKQPTSRHYDVMILDDTVNVSNVGSVKVMTKVEDNVRLLSSLLMPGYPMIFVGTRYHFADVYGKMEEDEGIGEEFFVFRRSCYADKENTPLFPRVLSKEELDKIRKQQGEYIFSCQYRLEPVNPDNIQFNVDRIKTYRKLPSALRYYIGFDPTSGTAKRGDPAAIVVMGVDTETGELYFVDGFRSKVQITEQLERFISFGMQYKPAGSKIEAIGQFAAAVETPLKERMMARSAAFPHEIVKGYARALTGGGTGEKPRLTAILCPAIDAGRVHFPERMVVRDEEGKQIDLIATILDEMKSYPFGKHDDMMDAMVLAMMSMPPIFPHKRRTFSERNMYGRNPQGEHRRESLYVSSGV